MTCSSAQSAHLRLFLCTVSNNADAGTNATTVVRVRVTPSWLTCSPSLVAFLPDIDGTCHSKWRNNVSTVARLECARSIPAPPYIGTEDHGRPFLLATAASRTFLGLTIATSLPPAILPDATSSSTAKRTSTSMQSTFTITPPMGLRAAAKHSPTAVVQAAWLILLAKYNGTDDVKIDMADVHHASLNEPHRHSLTVDINPSRAVGELLTHIQSCLTDTVSHDGKAVRNLFIQKSMGQRTLSEHRAVLQFEQAACSAMQLSGHVDMTGDTLVLSCSLSDCGTNVTVTHRNGAADSVQLSRFIRQLGRIVHSVNLQQADGTIAAVECMDPADVEELAIWNHHMPEPLDACMHDIVAHRAREDPQKIAVEAPDGNLTYCELERLANRLAIHLAGLGVEKGDMVPLCFEKSKLNVVATLAILKAGGALVPVDLQYPKARVESIVRQTKASVALASSRHAAVFEPHVEKVIAVSETSIAAMDVSDEEESRTAGWSSPGNAAYVIFTSGSTGTPKGVIIEHRGICTSMTAASKFLNIHRGSRVLQFASHAFDLSLMETFTALMNGGTICIPAEEERLNDLGALLRHMRITTTILTPSFARTVKPETLNELESLTLGGEAIANQDIADRVRRIKHLNGAYGPSETSCVSAAVRFSGDCVAADNIGRPLGSVNWIVDPKDHSKLVPIGAVGELVVEGPIVGPGYLADPEKTAAAFPPTPKWLRSMFPEREERLYRTGDLVRYNADGTIQYIGRFGTQVKLRGLRVELGEIEDQMWRCLEGSMDIAADVLAFKDRRDVLVGFLAPRESAPSRTAEGGVKLLLKPSAQAAALAETLRSKLAEVLPEYMVPVAFCIVSRMPLTVSGKCDRRSLRAWAATSTLAQVMGKPSVQDMLEPETESEIQLCEAWSQVLAVIGSEGTAVQFVQIGRESNFFACGADSLAAIKLVSVLRSNGRRLSVKEIFRNPTLKGMAVVMTSSDSADSETVCPFSTIEEPASLKSEVAETCNIAGTDVVDIWPCTPFQNAVLAISIRNPGAYVMQQAMEIPHSLSAAMIDEAWAAIKHGDVALRSRCVETTHGAMQVVLREQSFAAGLEHCDGLLEQILESEKARGIVPEESLARATVVHADRRYLVLTMHHAFGDLWSVSRLVSRLRKRMHGQDCKPPNSPALLAQFIRQQDHTQSSDAWRHYLEGAETVIFPSLPKPNHQSLSSGSLCHTVPMTRPTFTSVTIATAVRAAWALLVAKHTMAQDEVIFGSTVNGRTLSFAGIEEMTGPSIATVPVRARLPRPNTTLWDYMLRLQDEYAEVMAYEQVGLPAIAKASPEAGAACQFQNLLVVQPDNFPMHLGEGLAVSSSPMTLEYALVVNVSMRGDTLAIKASFDDRAIHQKQVHRLVRQFAYVYEQLCASGSTTAAKELDFVCREDATELTCWNSDISPPVDQCIHDLFQEQAKQRPDAQAVCSWDGSLTYAELDDLTSRLAGYLRHQFHFGPGKIVPYCFHKSLWVIVAILATLKSGAAVTAVDPTWPMKRANSLMEQTSANVVLGDQNAASYLEGAVSTILVVDSALLEKCSKQPPLPQGTPRDLLFVIFTSGSTGEPKGILIDHGTYATSVANHAEEIHLTSESRVFQYANYVYDISMLDILTTLSVGGCICVPSEAERLNDLAGAINRRNANWAHQTPTTAAILNPVDVPGLKHLVLGGESATPYTIAKWADWICLHYQYGPAETSILSNGISGLKSDHESTDTGHAYRCGFWIVSPDDHHQLCPIGAPGEVVIEGPIVGSGYLNNAIQTAAAFIAPPKWSSLYGATPGPRRFYKTGDVGRFGVDGSLHITGRKDSQIKIRGRRVELSEVEHQLRQCLAIPCHVVADLVRVDAGRAAPVIAAFVSAKDNTALRSVPNENGDAECLRTLLIGMLPVLRQDLARLLPHHMIPTLFIPVGAIPRTASGKLDRRCLRDIAAKLSSDEAAELSRQAGPSRPPSTASEKALLNTCATLLNLDLENLGLDDNWFLVGGDSVMAMRLVAALRRKDYDVTVHDIFDTPTLEALATRATPRKRSTTVGDPSPFTMVTVSDQSRYLVTLKTRFGISERTVQDIYPATPLQEGLWALNRRDGSAYHAQVIAQLPNHLDAARYITAWASVFETYDILRTVFVQFDDGLRQVVLNASIQVDELQVSSLRQFLDQDAQTAHADGQAIGRFSMVHDLLDDQHYFVWSTHHALYDGQCLSMILRAVEQAYGSRVLPEVVQFRHFVAGISGVDNRAADEFWRRALDNPETQSFPALPSPAYKPKPSAYIQHRFDLPRASASRFTTATLLQAAWSVLLSQYTGSWDVCFASVVNGRNSTVVASDLVMGPTLATVPFRALLTGDTRVADLLQQTLDTSVASLSFEHLGLQRIRGLSPGAAAACDLQNAFVVQPGSGSNSMLPESALGVRYSSGALGDFYTYPLTVECFVDGSHITVKAFFDEQVIVGTQMHRILAQFDHMCCELATSERSKKVCEIPMGTDDWLQIQSWNSKVPARIDLCLQDIFDDAASINCNACAISAWDGTLTFSEIQDLSSSYAVFLMEQGVSRGSRVLFCLEKTRYAIVWLLAILRTGAAVVPLDPAFPAHRMKLIADVTSSALAIASDTTVSILSTIVPTVVCSSDVARSQSAVGSRSLLPQVEPTDVAMVYFTSGSTGIPKAVPQRHYMISTSISHQVHAWALPAESRVLQFASNSFDTFLVEAFGALMSRSILCVPSEEEKMSNLQAFMQKTEVSVAYLTPTVVRLLDPLLLPRMRTLFVTGEALSRDIVARWSNRTALRNAYGITETMLSCTLSAPLRPSSTPGNIGRGYSCITWIVDKSNINRLAPIGTPGELIVEGPCVALEYLNDDKRSGEAFVSAPAWLRQMYPSRLEQKVYRSSDLVRYAPDGTIEYTARADKDEVKIHGQRVNVGEVEFHLSECLPKSAFCAVDLVEFSDVYLGPRLVAFVPWNEAQGGKDEIDAATPFMAKPLQDTTRIRGLLRDRLPERMCPSVYLRVSRLPTTVSGKLDRHKLRSMARGLQRTELIDSQQANSPNRPLTDMESKLQDLWAMTLGIEPGVIAVDANLFHLGGDSIAAMRLAARAYSANVELTVVQIFQFPVLAAMAEAAKSAQMSTEYDILPFSLLPPDTLIEDPLFEINNLDALISRNSVEDAYPCSQMQHALLAASTQDRTAYTSQFVFDLPDAVGFEALEAAWANVASRHPILRTRFVQTSTGTLQVVLRDSRSVFCSEEATGPAFLTKLVTVQGARQMVIRAHHATFDGWMMPRILEDLTTAFFGYRQSPVVPYNRFIDYSSRQMTTSAEAYWRAVLDGAAPSEFPEMPSDYKPRTTALAQHYFRLPSREHTEVTTGSLLCAAWALLVAKYTCSTDVVFGHTLTGRAAHLPGIHDVAGPTIVSVPFRVNTAGELSVSEYMQAVQRRVIDGIPYEQYGLQNIRRLGTQFAPLCNLRTIFVVQSIDEDWGGRLGLVENTHDRRQVHPQAINLQCIIRDSKVVLEANYDSTICSAKQIQRMLTQVDSIVHRLSKAGPNVKLQSIDILSQTDQREIECWNGKMPPLLNDCMHGVIERHAVETPSAQAICAWDGGLTYRELDFRATQLAQHLHERFELEPDDIVLLYFEKSMWTAVCMYAVQKAGAAYGFLGLTDPVARIKMVIKTTKARLILTSESLHNKLAHLPFNVLAVAPALFQHLPNGVPQFRCNVKPHNLAYVLFTSGSTGVPKAVMVEHAAGTTSAIAHGTVEGVGPESRVYQFASHTFDVSTSEILTTLIMGGCVCIPSEVQRINDLAGSINSFGVNHAFLTPTVVSLLDPKSIPNVKLLKLGGEALTRENVAIWADKVQLSNSYGVCEAAIRSCFRNRITPDTDFSNCGSAVGCALWICDLANYHLLAPIGAVGELVIEGPTLARGYMCDEDKTAQAFVRPSWLRDMFPDRPQRVYRTGDLVCYADDGTIRFVGRSDTQVKIHGQRTELREIEHRITIGAAAGLGAVVVPKRGPHTGKLVGLLAFTDALVQDGVMKILPPSSNEMVMAKFERLEVQLAETLPPHMVPHTWIAVEGLPINLSGKMNRLLLIKWIEELSPVQWQEIEDVSRQSTEGCGEKHPLTAMEKEIRDMWSRVLNAPAEAIDADASFFKLGGDSISAMQIASLARARGLQMSMQDIMACKVLSSLASCVTLAKEAAPVRAAPRYAMDGSAQSFPLSPIQLMFFDQTPEGSVAYQQGIYVRMRRSVDPALLDQALAQMVRRHAMLRARFKRNDQGAWRQQIIAFSPLCFDFTEVQVRRTDEIPDIIRLRQQCVDFQEGPVFVATLFSAKDSQFLHLTAHHLVTDLVSWRIVLQGIEDVLQGKKLPPQSLSFPEWSVLQEEDALRIVPSEIHFEPTLEDDDFWEMSGKPNGADDIVNHQFVLSEESTASILHQAEDSSGAAAIDVLLGVLAFNFHQVFHDRGPAEMYNEGHGREPLDANMDLSDTVGWFATRCPIAIPKEACVSLKECVRASRHSRRTAKDNGRSWFASRYHHTEGQKRFGRKQRLELALNYRGLMQQLERADAIFESTDKEFHAHDLALERFALIEVDVMASRGRFTITLEWNCRMQHQERLTQWASLCQQTFNDAESWASGLLVTPTVSDFALTGISNTQLEKLTSSILTARTSGATPVIADIMPATDMQQGLLTAAWQNDQSYQVRLYLHVKSNGGAQVDMTLLAAAWQAVVSKHASLRTVLYDDAQVFPRPVQVVLSNFIDDPTHSGAVDELDALRKHRAQPYDGARQPAQKMTFYQLSTGAAVCALDIGHILTDAWCSSLLIRHLGAAYDGLLPSLPQTSLRGFSSYLTPEKCTKTLQYWTQRLQGVKPCLLPGFEGQAERSGFVTVDVSLENIDFQTLCREHSITPAVFFQAVYALTLRVFTGSDNVVFGYLSSGRDVPVADVEDTFGAFIAMLIRQCSIRTFDSVLTLLNDLQQDHLTNLSHQHFSIAALQRELGLIGKPLFNSTMSVHTQAVKHKKQDSGVRIDWLGMDDPTEHALTANVLQAETSFHAEFTSNAKLLSEQQTERIAMLFLNVAKSIVEDPLSNVADLEIMTEAYELQTVRHYNEVNADCWVVDGANVNHLLPAGAIGKILLRGHTVERERLVDASATQVVFAETPRWAETASSNGRKRERFYFSGHKARMASTGGMLEIIDTQQLDDESIIANVNSNTPNAEQEDEREDEQNQDPSTSEVQPDELPKSDKEITIRGVWARVLGLNVHDVGCKQSFFQLGGDSISAMRVAKECRKDGLEVASRDILKHKTITRVAAIACEIVTQCSSGNSGSSGSSNRAAAQGLDHQSFELSPIQQMHVQRDPELCYRFNQSVMVEIPSSFQQESLVSEAIAAAVMLHPMLRARIFKNEEGHFVQHVPEDEQSNLRFRASTVRDVAHLQQEILHCQQDVSVNSGVNVAASLLYLGSRCFLFLAANHLFVDLVSWQILLGDVAEYLTDKAISGPPSLISYGDWMKNESSKTSAGPLLSALQASSSPSTQFDFVDYWHLSPPFKHGETIHTQHRLSKLETSVLLGPANLPYDTQPVDLVLSALLFSFSQTFSDRPLPIVHFESHGRGDAGISNTLDVSRTVGWFTTLCTLAISPDSAANKLDGITREIKDLRRRLSSTRVDYGGGRAPFELLFNYTGGSQLQETRGTTCLRSVQDLEIDMHDVSLELPQLSLFTVEAAIVSGRLTFELGYSARTRQQHQVQVESWWDSFHTTLANIATSLPKHRQTLTMSDVPSFRGSYAVLDNVVSLAQTQVGIESIDDIADIAEADPTVQHMISSERTRPGLLNCYIVFDIHGTTDTRVLHAKFQAAWQRIVNRHDILRSVFVVEDEARSWQIVLKKLPVSVRETWADQASIVQKIAEDPVPHALFTPAHAMELCRAPGGGMFGVLRISHLISDAASRPPIYRELARALNENFVKTQAPSYAVTSRAVSVLQENSFDFWEKYTFGLLPCHLPTDYKSSTHNSFEYASVDVPLPPTGALRHLCGKEDVTMGNILTAAWSTLLSLCIGSPTVCFEQTTSGRDERVEGIHSAIGPYFNSHLSKGSVDGHSTLLDVLHQVQADFLETLPHQNVSAAAVGARYNRPLTTHANTAVNFIKLSPEEDVPINGRDEIWIEEVHADGGLYHDYLLLANEKQGSVTTRLLYRRCAVTPGKVQRLCSLLGCIFAEMVASPSTTTIGDLGARIL